MYGIKRTHTLTFMEHFGHFKFSIYYAVVALWRLVPNHAHDAKRSELATHKHIILIWRVGCAALEQ